MLPHHTKTYSTKNTLFLSLGSVSTRNTVLNLHSVQIYTNQTQKVVLLLQNDHFDSTILQVATSANVSSLLCI